MLQRMKYVLSNDEADLNLQAIILIAVGLIIAGVIFLLGDKIQEFLKNAAGKVDDINNSMENGFSLNGFGS